MIDNNIICLEGPEGCGKTTIAPILKEKLEQEGYDVIISREPGGTQLGEKIRNILRNDNMAAMTELLLFMGARYEHYDKVIRPHIENGGIVILDRYIPSSIAIQGYAKDLGHIVSYLHDLVMPIEAREYTSIFIDIPVELGLERKTTQEDGISKFELEGLEFHEKVYKGYKDLIGNEEFNFVVVDGLQSPDDIVRDILNSIILKEGHENG